MLNQIICFSDNCSSKDEALFVSIFEKYLESAVHISDSCQVPFHQGEAYALRLEEHNFHWIEMFQMDPVCTIFRVWWIQSSWFALSAYCTISQRIYIYLGKVGGPIFIDSYIQHLNKDKTGT